MNKPNLYYVKIMHEPELRLPLKAEIDAGIKPTRFLHLELYNTAHTSREGVLNTDTKPDITLMIYEKVDSLIYYDISNELLPQSISYPYLLEPTMPGEIRQAGLKKYFVCEIDMHDDPNILHKLHSNPDLLPWVDYTMSHLFRQLNS